MPFLATGTITACVSLLFITIYRERCLVFGVNGDMLKWNVRFYGRRDIFVRSMWSATQPTHTRTFSNRSRRRCGWKKAVPGNYYDFDDSIVFDFDFDIIQAIMLGSNERKIQNESNANKFHAINVTLSLAHGIWFIFFLSFFCYRNKF